MNGSPPQGSAGCSASAQERIADCLARIAALDPRVGAFDRCFEADALSAAERHDGLDAADPSSRRLDAMPVAVKDVFDVAGMVTAAGCPALTGPPATRSAAVVERLEAAGAIIVGKCRMSELAYDSRGQNAFQGTPRNPWDRLRARVPGGSSSGSAVAVATGMVPVSIGSDTGGSVRIPAALCGVAALKTTRGSVDHRGLFPLSETFDSVGIIGERVADIARVYRVLATGGYDRGRATDGLVMRDLRLALLPEADLAAADPVVLAGCEEAIRLLRHLGMRPPDRPVDPALTGFAEPMSCLIRAEAFRRHGAWIRRSVLPPTAAMARVLAGEGIDDGALVRIRRRRLVDRAAFDDVWRSTDVIACPTTPTTAPLVDDRAADDASLCLFTRGVNYLDLCALALPCGLSPFGLPISFQLVAPAFAEERLLAIGEAFEALAIRHRPHPEFLST